MLELEDGSTVGVRNGITVKDPPPVTRHMILLGMSVGEFIASLDNRLRKHMSDILQLQIAVKKRHDEAAESYLRHEALYCESPSQYPDGE